MKTLGVIANTGKPDSVNVLARLSKKAAEKDLKLLACDETADLLADVERVDEEHFPHRIDVLMALGGDGTMLSAVRALRGTDTPVVGVNLGSLGFMTSVTQETLEHAIDVLIDGSYTISTRTRARASIIRDYHEVKEYRALNDMVIGWGASSRVLTLGLSINDEDVTSYICDGLMISTPTGSTGHSLSAGGPILHPQTPAFVINVICPHTLSTRPLIVPDDSSITIHVMDMAKDKKVLLSVDGQEEQPFEEGDRLVVKKTSQGVRFIHLPGYSYFDVLRQKLHWRGSNV